MKISVNALKNKILNHVTLEKNEESTRHLDSLFPVP